MADDPPEQLEASEDEPAAKRARKKPSASARVRIAQPENPNFTPSVKDLLATLPTDKRALPTPRTYAARADFLANTKQRHAFRSMQDAETTRRRRPNGSLPKVTPATLPPATIDEALTEVSNGAPWQSILRRILR